MHRSAHPVRRLGFAALFALLLFAIAAPMASASSDAWAQLLTGKAATKAAPARPPAAAAVHCDVRHLGVFLDTVAYTANLVPERVRVLYGLNPMAGVVEGFRWALLGRGDPPGGMMLVSMSVVVIVLVSGLFYFRRMERTFADII